MAEADKPVLSSPGQGLDFLKFQLPEVEDVEVYLVRLADGTIVTRTRAEIEKLEKGATVTGRL